MDEKQASRGLDTVRTWAKRGPMMRFGPGGSRPNGAFSTETGHNAAPKKTLAKIEWISVQNFNAILMCLGSPFTCHPNCE